MSQIVVPKTLVGLEPNLEPRCRVMETLKPSQCRIEVGSQINRHFTSITKD